MSFWGIVLTVFVTLFAVWYLHDVRKANQFFRDTWAYFKDNAQ